MDYEQLLIDLRDDKLMKLLSHQKHFLHFKKFGEISHRKTVFEALRESKVTLNMSVQINRQRNAFLCYNIIS